MAVRLAGDDSIRQTLFFSYDFHLAGTFYFKKDSKAQMIIDGETAGRAGAKNYVLRFLANGRTGSLWINAQTAELERIEWASGKSLGLASSGEKSMIELAPVIEPMVFPTKLIFNERSRTLLRRTGSYTEIETRNFQREDTR